MSHPETASRTAPAPISPTAAPEWAGAGVVDARPASTAVGSAATVPGVFVEWCFLWLAPLDGDWLLPELGETDADVDADTVADTDAEAEADGDEDAEGEVLGDGEPDGDEQPHWGCRVPPAPLPVA